MPKIRRRVGGNHNCMKKLILKLLFLPVLVISQTSINIGKEYVFTVPTAVYNSDIFGVHVKNTHEEPPIGSKFKVIHETDTTYVISFSMWKLPKSKTQENTIFYNNQLDKIKRFNLKTVDIENTEFIKKDEPITENIRYFVVYKVNLDKKCVSIEEDSKWQSVSGAMVLPFKLRPQNGDFTKDVTINGIVGAGYKFTKYHTLNGMLGLGIASVTLDSLNTKGTLRKSSDRAAISLNLGLLYQYKQIQIGVIAGFDFLNQTSADNWIYNKKLWFGLGVGVNLFKSDDKPSDTPEIKN